MSNVGEGPVIPIGVVVVLPLLAGAGLLYLAFKGVCLAGRGAKFACDEVKRRREEAALRRARDLALLEKLKGTDTERAKVASVMKQVGRRVEEIRQNRKENALKQKKMAQEWKKSHQDLLEARFSKLAKMGVEQNKINKVRENYLKSLAQFSPPEPSYSNDPIDWEVEGLKARANAIKKCLEDSGLSPGHLEYFNQLLEEGKNSDAISEGYRLLRLGKKEGEIKDRIFSIRLDLLATSYIPGKKKKLWLQQLSEAENKLLSGHLSEATNLVEEIRSKLNEFERQIDDVEAYKALASKARGMLDKIEAFCNECLLPDIESRKDKVQQVRNAFEEGDYEQAIQEGDALLKAWEAEEDELLKRGSEEVEEVTVKSVREVLTEMGYEVEVKGSDILGRKGNKTFRVSYDPDLGQVKYDLSHEGFPSQKVCDREMGEFLLRLAEKGILIDSDPQPTHPKGNVVENIAEEIMNALGDIGIDANEVQREEEEGSIRLLIKAGWEEREVQIDEDGAAYLDGERLVDTGELIENLKEEGIERGRELE